MVDWPHLEQEMRRVLRLRHTSLKTEKAHLGWFRRFRAFVDRPPRDLQAGEVEAFLSHISMEVRVSASTQNQAVWHYYCSKARWNVETQVPKAKAANNGGSGNISYRLLYLNVKIFGDALASMYGMFYRALDAEDPDDPLRATRLFMYDRVKLSYLADLDVWRAEQDAADSLKTSKADQSPHPP